MAQGYDNLFAACISIDGFGWIVLEEGGEKVLESVFEEYISSDALLFVVIVIMIMILQYLWNGGDG